MLDNGGRLVAGLNIVGVQTAFLCEFLAMCEGMMKKGSCDDTEQRLCLLVPL